MSDQIHVQWSPVNNDAMHMGAYMFLYFLYLVKSSHSATYTEYILNLFPLPPLCSKLPTILTSLFHIIQSTQNKHNFFKKKKNIYSVLQFDSAHVFYLILYFSPLHTILSHTGYNLVPKTNSLFLGSWLPKMFFPPIPVKLLIMA